jgi:hypothetical protein
MRGGAVRTTRIVAPEGEVDHEREELLDPEGERLVGGRAEALRGGAAK